MLKLHITRRAGRHLEEIFDYIQTENPRAAQKVYQAFWQSFHFISEFPQTGRSGSKLNTREFVVQGLPYLIVYTMEGQAVFILSIFHTKRDYTNPNKDL